MIIWKAWAHCGKAEVSGMEDTRLLELESNLLGLDWGGLGSPPTIILKAWAHFGRGQVTVMEGTRQLEVECNHLGFLRLAGRPSEGGGAVGGGL